MQLVAPEWALPAVTVGFSPYTHVHLHLTMEISQLVLCGDVAYLNGM